MKERYFYPTRGRWAISRQIGEQSVYLVQDSPLVRSGDARLILQALRIQRTEENLDLYFPYRTGKGRCPTLDLLELCATLDSTNPLVSLNLQDQVGV